MSTSSKTQQFDCQKPHHRRHQPHPPTPPQEREDAAAPSTTPLTANPPPPTTDDTSFQAPLSSNNVIIPTTSPPASILTNGLHVLHTASVALAHLSQFYSTSHTAQAAFTLAVKTIVTRASDGGKLVICGMGKSGRIGDKLVATFNSLGIVSMFLHPGEAVHGDLGMVTKNDTLLFLTQSGTTLELHAVLPHLPSTCPRIILTAHTSSPPFTHTTPHSFTPRPGASTRRGKLSTKQPTYIILPTPVPQTETENFGVPAPTTSITVTLAVGHALAVAAAKERYESGNHLNASDTETDDGDTSQADDDSQEDDPLRQLTFGSMDPAEPPNPPISEDLEDMKEDLRRRGRERRRERKRRRRTGGVTVAQVFARNHPGGALGAASAKEAALHSRGKSDALNA